jgi:hypothetical protein
MCCERRQAADSAGNRGRAFHSSAAFSPSAKPRPRESLPSQRDPRVTKAFSGEIIVFLGEIIAKVKV